MKQKTKIIGTNQQTTTTTTSSSSSSSTTTTTANTIGGQTIIKSTNGGNSRNNSQRQQNGMYLFLKNTFFPGTFFFQILFSTKSITGISTGSTIVEHQQQSIVISHFFC